MGQGSKSMKLPDSYEWNISHFQLLVEIHKNLRKQTVSNKHIAAFLVTLEWLLAAVFVCLQSISWSLRTQIETEFLLYSPQAVDKIETEKGVVAHGSSSTGANRHLGDQTRLGARVASSVTGFRCGQCQVQRSSGQHANTAVTTCPVLAKASSHSYYTQWICPKYVTALQFENLSLLLLRISPSLLTPPGKKTKSMKKFGLVSDGSGCWFLTHLLLGTITTNTCLFPNRACT